MTIDIDNTPYAFGVSEGAFNLNESEARLALGFLLYRMGQDTRGLLAAHLPHIYNKICGRDLMAVAWRTDGGAATPGGGRGASILLPEALNPDA